LIQKFYPDGKAERFCAQVFKTFGKYESSKIQYFFFLLDSDDNGYIDFVEFLIAVNITSHGLYIKIQKKKKIQI